MDEKVRLKAFFKSNCVRVALTSDCWTSIQNVNYLTPIAHSINNDWRYQKRIICFSFIPNHKRETIGRKVEEVSKEWGPMKNMGGLVMDGKFFHELLCSYTKLSYE